MQTRFYFFGVSLLAIACSDKPGHSLQEVRKLDYPSASGTEYLNKQLFIIGDDAQQLLILDSNLVIKDSIALYNLPGKRLPKATKPDLEAISIVRSDHRNKLLLLGSGSLSPYRNSAWLIDPFRKQKDSVSLDSFFSRLLSKGLKEINIEGACSIPGAVLLANRGHKAYRSNMLVVAKEGFWTDPTKADFEFIRVGVNNDTAVFNGVSGLAYASKSDRLVLTVSTEDTRSSYEDGAIGKSYIWIIKNISSKKEWSAINPDEVIDLESIDQRFKGFKIESVSITGETKKLLHLVLAADNDDGSSTLFKITVAKD